jgi:histidyl-tRNA synthetase
MIISIISDIFKALKIPYFLEINSLGCKTCMTIYKKKLIEKLNIESKNLCSDCIIRIDKNPLRVFDCKNDSCKSILKDIPTITYSICNTCNSDFSTLQNILKKIDIDFKINPFLVRGLDYYNKTAFEFTCSKVGAQNAIAGGGRYDSLVEMLDGKETSAIGFAIGIDRILPLIELPINREGYYIGAMGEDSLEKAIYCGFEKQKTEKIFIQFEEKKLKNHLKLADKINARYCAIIGENELKENKIWIKDLVNKNEVLVDINEF